MFSAKILPAKVLIGCSFAIILLTQFSFDKVKKDSLVKITSICFKEDHFCTRAERAKNECQRLREQGKLREPFLLEQNFITLKRFGNLFYYIDFEMVW